MGKNILKFGRKMRNLLQKYFLITLYLQPEMRYHSDGFFQASPLFVSEMFVIISYKK